MISFEFNKWMAACVLLVLVAFGFDEVVHGSGIGPAIAEGIKKRWVNKPPKPTFVAPWGVSPQQQTVQGQVPGDLTWT